MSTPYVQKAEGAMAYPAPGTFNQAFFKAPLVLWRMGLGPILGRSMLALTTWGRKSRLPRHTMLSYTDLDGRLYVISGWGERSDWYRNTIADPHVTVQLAHKSFHAVVRRVTDLDEYRAVMHRMLQTGGDSHFAPWLESLGIAQDLDDLVAKRERVHLAALDVTDQSGPPPLEVDLGWVWGLALGAFALGWLSGRFSRKWR